MILNEVRYKELAPLLHYIYYGEVELPRSQVHDFLKTAKYLQVRGLRTEEEYGFDATVDSPSQEEDNAKSDYHYKEKVTAATIEQTVSVSSTQSPDIQSSSIDAPTSNSPSSNQERVSERIDNTVSITPKSPSPKIDNEESSMKPSINSPPQSPAHKKPKLTLSHSVYDSSSSPGPRMTPPSILSHPLASALKPTLPHAGLPVLPGVPMPPMPIPPTSFPPHSLPTASAAQAFSQHMSQHMSHHFSQQMSHQMNHPLSHPMSQHMSQQMSHQLSQQMSQQMSHQQGSQPPSDDASDTCASDKSEERAHSRPDQEPDEDIDNNSLEKMSGLANMAALKGLHFNTISIQLFYV